jgi:hypothetical protein
MFSASARPRSVGSRRCALELGHPAGGRPPDLHNLTKESLGRGARTHPHRFHALRAHPLSSPSLALRAHPLSLTVLSLLRYAPTHCLLLSLHRSHDPSSQCQPPLFPTPTTQEGARGALPGQEAITRRVTDTGRHTRCAYRSGSHNKVRQSALAASCVTQ